MKNFIFFKSLDLLFILVVLSFSFVFSFSPVVGQSNTKDDSVVTTKDTCNVSAPGGIAIHVRDSPDGILINNLRHGRELSVSSVSLDKKGRPWAYVEGSYKGKWRRWGWVFKAFLICHRSNPSFRKSDDFARACAIFPELCN